MLKKTNVKSRREPHCQIGASHPNLNWNCVENLNILYSKWSQAYCHMCLALNPLSYFLFITAIIIVIIINNIINIMIIIIVIVNCISPLHWVNFLTKGLKKKKSKHFQCPFDLPLHLLTFNNSHWLTIVSVKFSITHMKAKNFFLNPLVLLLVLSLSIFFPFFCTFQQNKNNNCHGQVIAFGEFLLTF